MQEPELSPYIQNDAVLNEFAKVLLRNKNALSELILKNGIADIELYRYAAGKYWGMEFALQSLTDIVAKYNKQEGD